MKKSITLLSIATSMLLILDSFNAGDALVAFVLTGTLPGTHITINASVMLGIYALLAGFIFSRLFSVKRNTTLSPEL